MAGRLDLKRLQLVWNSMSAVLSVQTATHMSKALAQSLASPAVHICLNCVLHMYCYTVYMYCVLYTSLLNAIQSEKPSSCAKQVAHFCLCAVLNGQWSFLSKAESIIIRQAVGAV